METLLTGKVKNALNCSPYLSGSKLNFETDGGRVVLRGIVPSFFQKQMAQESLRGVGEIKELLNELEVMGRSFRVDHEID